MFARNISRSLARLAQPAVRPPPARNIYIRFETLPPGGGYKRISRYERLKDRAGAVKYMWNTPVFRRWVAGTTAAGGAFYVYNLEVVPVSGRRRFNIISADNEAKLAAQMYQDTLAEFGPLMLPSSHPTAKLVARVLDR